MCEAPWSGKAAAGEHVGITETTVHVTYHPITQEDAESESGHLIGGRIRDLSTYVLDRYRQPVPVGLTGKMYVGKRMARTVAQENELVMGITRWRAG